jgi:hypothetical protein
MTIKLLNSLVDNCNGGGLCLESLHHLPNNDKGGNANVAITYLWTRREHITSLLKKLDYYQQ